MSSAPEHLEIVADERKVRRFWGPVWLGEMQQKWCDCLRQEVSVGDIRGCRDACQLVASSIVNIVSTKPWTWVEELSCSSYDSNIPLPTCLEFLCLLEWNDVLRIPADDTPLWNITKEIWTVARIVLSSAGCEWTPEFNVTSGKFCCKKCLQGRCHRGWQWSRTVHCMYREAYSVIWFGPGWFGLSRLFIIIFLSFHLHGWCVASCSIVSSQGSWYIIFVAGSGLESATSKIALLRNFISKPR